MVKRRAGSGWALAMALMVACSFSLPSAAHGAADDDVARAKVLYSRAERFFFIGEFKRALDLYTEAFRTKPLTGFLFNIGQCQRKLGDCRQAIFNFKQYLHHKPDAPNRAVVEQLIALCEAKLTGEKAARARTKAQTKASRPDTSSTPGTSRQRLSPIWFWSTAGLAVALLATGAATGAVALNKSAEYKDPTTPIPRRIELKDEAAPFRPLSTATLVAGAAAAVGAGVLYYMTWRRGEGAQPKETPTVSAGIVPSGATVLFQGSF